MPLELKEYNPSGRTYDQLDELNQPTGKKVYKSKVGEQNVYTDGAYHPYYVDGDRVLYGHGENEILFESGQQVLKRAGNTLVSSSKFFVQAYIGGEWVTQNHGVPIRNLAHNYPSEGNLTGYLDFPDAHLSFGSQDPYDLQIGLTVGSRNIAKLGFRFRALRSGQVRFVWINDGIQKLLNGDFEWIETSGFGFGGEPREVRKVGIKFKNIEFRWTWEEAANRTLEIIENPDGSKRLAVVFGPYDYTANEWLWVFPDTWGPTEVSDDCYEENESSYYDDATGVGYPGQIALGAYSYPYDVGLLFDNVTISGTINSATIEIMNVGWFDGSQIYTDLYVCDEDSPAAWGAANRPSQQALHADPLAFDISGTGDITSGNFATSLQHRVDDVDWDSGDNLAIVILTDYTSSAWNLCVFNSTENASTATELTIVYTPSGSPTTLAPTTVQPTTLAPTTIVTTATPTTLSPTTVPPTTIIPTTIAPTTVSPTTVSPTTIAPTTVAPTTSEPTTPSPTTLAPTTIITTQAPTTLAPTTVSPTTILPTTLVPTTIVPTTIAPTTAAPTTLSSTTLAPTTIEVTTLAPTTLVPTTIGPTTLPPPTTSPPIPVVTRRGISNFGFSFRDRWR